MLVTDTNGRVIKRKSNSEVSERVCEAARENAGAALGWLIVICGLLLAAGCEHHPVAQPATQEFSGIKEYKAIAENSSAAVDAALKALEHVAGHPQGTSIEEFSQEVQRLQINSIQVRARVRAIQARGDAYFKTWTESTAQISDASVRERVRSHHDQLEQSFLKVKLASQEAGAAFKPFLSSLRKLRVQLEQNTAATNGTVPEELVREGRAQGQTVLHKLGTITQELNDVLAMLNAGGRE